MPDHVFMGPGTDMGSDDGAWGAQQGMVGGRRLLVHHIRGIAAEMPGMQSIKQRFRIDQFATGAID